MTRGTATTAALSIPKERLYPTTAEPNLAPEPYLSMLTRLLPLVALAGGYTAALSSTARFGVLASALLLIAMVAVIRLGYALACYAIAAIRRRRSGTGR